MLICSNGFRDASKGTRPPKYRTVIVVRDIECFERVDREMSYEVENSRFKTTKRRERRMSFSICYIYDVIVNQHY